MADLNAPKWTLVQRVDRMVGDTAGERIGAGSGFTEGPVWLSAEAAAHNGLRNDTAGLYFSDIDGDTTYVGTYDGLTVVRRPKWPFERKCPRCLRSDRQLRTRSIR